MQRKNRILIPDSMWKGTDENKTPQKLINWPNKTTYVTIFYEKRDLLTDSLHLVCSRILQITKMGCCGNCHVLFSLLRRKRERKKKPSKYLLKHKYSINFYCSLHPKRTNLLTEVLFFHNLKNGFAFCCLQFHYIYYQFMQMGKKKNPLIYKRDGYRLPESQECDQAIVFYSIPTFIIDSSFSQFDSIDVSNLCMILQGIHWELNT